jgi:hypothetical protein
LLSLSNTKAARQFPCHYQVRRKRKRHLVSSAYNCCLICNDPAEVDAAYTDTLFYASPRRTGSSNFQGLGSEVCVSSPARDSNLLGSLPPDVTVDTFLKRRVYPAPQVPRKFKARIHKLGTNADDGQMECLHLRSRRIQRTAADLPTPPIGAPRAIRKSRKPKRNRLAEKLLTAVMMTCSEPNEDLLQSGADERISLPMTAEPRSLARSKPRKWGLVDPRKVTTPFRASVFQTTGKGRTLAETPTSYEQFAYERFEVARDRGGDIEDWQGLQEPSSPCVAKSRQRQAARRDTVNFSEPSQLEPKKRIKKPRYLVPICFSS